MLVGYEFFYRQQLENLFTMLSAPIPTPIAISRPRPRSRLRSAIRTNQFLSFLHSHITVLH